MKKMSCIALWTVCFLAGAGLVFAQGMPAMKGSMNGSAMMENQQGTMMGYHHGMMWSGARKWGRGMKEGNMAWMHGMMKPTMVASGDGGVIVLSGMTLYKYDKNLNLVKQTQIKLDTAGMQEMAKQMQATCAICPFAKKGMAGSGTAVKSGAAPNGK